MMNFDNTIFTPEDDVSTEGDAEQEDQETALAGALFVKLAQEAGIDPSDLTPEERTQYIQQLRGVAEGTSKESHMSTETETPEFTEAQYDAFVTQEAMKIAAGQGVDVTTMSADDFAGLKLATHELIQADPDGYVQGILEAEQAAEIARATEEDYAVKMAQADEAGRQMARSFHAELALITQQEEKPAEGEKVASVADLTKKFHGVAERVGRGTEKMTGLGKKGAEKATEAGGDAVKSHYAGLGKKVMGGAAAAGAVGTAAGAAAAHNRKKKSDEEIKAEGLAVARAFLIGQGIDPDLGGKVASVDTEQLDPEVVAAARELLLEKGYIEG